MTAHLLYDELTCPHRP